MSRKPSLFLWAYGSFVAMILIIPTLVVVPISFSEKKSFAFPPSGFSLKWFQNFFSDERWMGSLQSSLLVGVCSALLATILGTAAAIGLHRQPKTKISAAVQAFLGSPMVIPGIILAIGIYGVFSTLRLVGTFHGFVLAHTALALPFVLISVNASLTVFDETLEAAAGSLGASPFTVLRTVTVPLILPGVLSGALFAFVTSFDEVLISLFIKSPYLETLPVKMFSSISEDNDPTIAAASVMILTLTTCVIVASGVVKRINNKKKGASE